MEQPTEQQQERTLLTTAPAPRRLEPNEIRLLTEARNERLRLEGKRFALDEAVSRIERWQVVYDVLSIVLAIWLLIALWGIRLLIPPGDVQEWADKIATFGGTLLSFAVISLTLWSWRKEWGAQVEAKRGLSRTARELMSEYEEIANEAIIDLEKLRKWHQKRIKFEDDMGHRWARYSLRCRQLGHQHVGIRHHRDMPIECEQCGRRWEPRFAQLSTSWKSYFKGCRGCGIEFPSQGDSHEPRAS